MALPLAYFLTWTCYGQRLHGDERGAVDREHNTPGTPLLKADAKREAAERALQAGATVSLSREMMMVTDAAIVGLCSEKHWRLLAHNVRSTHVHVVVSCSDGPSPERVMAQLKARATRDLRRERLAAADANPWTRHGSTRWINYEAGVYGAIGYVNDWQSGPKREMPEEHRAKIREQIEGLRAWLRAQGLPEHGRVFVDGYEPRTD